MPYLAKMLCSNHLRDTKRALFAVPRRLTGKPLQAEVYLEASDPYSYLLVQVLPELMRRYGLKISIHTLAAYQRDMFPDFANWQRNALEDAARLARLYDLKAPARALPGAQRVDDVRRAILALEQSESGVTQIEGVLTALHRGYELQSGHVSDAAAQWAANAGRLRKQGHYLAATIYFEGEWYWGVDRLIHLEQRLNHITGQRDIKYDRQIRWLRQGTEMKGTLFRNDAASSLEIFFSARSPYSYLGLEQAVQMCEQAGAELVVKPVLPMMMRGMNVPQTKKMYIFHDTKREAALRGIPYGKVADPLGEAVERCYAVWQWAQGQQKGTRFLLTFGRMVNAEGVRADTDKGLAKIVEQAGLDWQGAKASLQDESWRSIVAENLNTLKDLGLWGVPCFRVGETVVWGQDRLWVMAEQLASGD